MMSGQLIVLDKYPRVRPVKVGETWQRLTEKCLLQVTGQEAKAACGTEQLFRGVDAGIEGGMHAMRLLWAQHSQEEDWGFLLIDVWNAFNEENRTAILWAFCQEWTSGAQFTFKCYRFWATLVVRNTEDRLGQILHSKEGVTQ